MRLSHHVHGLSKKFVISCFIQELQDVVKSKRPGSIIETIYWQWWKKRRQSQLRDLKGMPIYAQPTLLTPLEEAISIWQEKRA